MAGPSTVRINAKTQSSIIESTNHMYGSLYPFTTPNQVCMAIASTKKPLATSPICKNHPWRKHAPVGATILLIRSQWKDIEKAIDC
jgi:hypothetical protein